MKPRVIDIERHEFLKARLRISGTSLAQVARDLGISHTSVSSVSLGTSTSKAVEAYISEKLQQNPQDIWPERYKREDPQ